MTDSQNQFQKSFVLAEWLAVQTVVDLLREAGLDNSHFVSTSRLVGDEGEAPGLAAQGRDLYDRQGVLVKNEELSVEDLGLGDDIEALHLRPEDDSLDQPRCFLKRTYTFDVHQHKQRTSYVSVWIGFAKRTEHSDWELVHECVIDQRHSGDARYVVYRTTKR